MGLTPRDRWNVVVYALLGLVAGALPSWSIYESVLTWVPPPFAALWAGGVLLRARRAERAVARRAGATPTAD